ncbi:energy transducer TonB [Flaviaesturariibacter terrae]
MSPNEITRSSLLDLLFEHRNKQYGAYVLRKYYGNRLSLAIGIMLAAVLLGLFLLNLLAGKPERGFLPPDRGVLVQLAPDPVTQPDQPKPKPVQRAGAAAPTVGYTQPLIGPDPTDVPPTDAVGNSAIGTHTTPGDGPGDLPAPGVDPVPPGPAPLAAAPAEPEAPSAPPSFPGGMKAWGDFLARYLQAPADMEPGEKRSVLVRFWVDEEGNVGRFEFLQSGGQSFDSEVLRVLRKMPKWKPALQRGRAVATSFVQPVTFQAPEE